MVIRVTPLIESLVSTVAPGRVDTSFLLKSRSGTFSLLSFRRFKACWQLYFLLQVLLVHQCLGNLTEEVDTTPPTEAQEQEQSVPPAESQQNSQTPQTATTLRTSTNSNPPNNPSVSPATNLLSSHNNPTSSNNQEIPLLRGKVSTFNNNDGIVRIRKQDVCIYTDYQGFFGQVNVMVWMAAIKTVKTKLSALANQFTVLPDKDKGIKRIFVKNKRAVPTQAVDATLADSLSWIFNNLTLERLPFESASKSFMNMYMQADVWVKPHPGLLLNMTLMVLRKDPFLKEIQFSEFLNIMEWNLMAAMLESYITDNKAHDTSEMRSTFKDVEHHDEFQLQTQAIMLTMTMLQTIVDIAVQLDEQILPPNLFDGAQLSAFLDKFIEDTIGGLFTRSEIETILRNNPLTYPFKNCRFDCNLNIATLIPITSEIYRYEHWKLLSFPTFQDGVFSDNWKRVNLPIIHYLKKGSKQIPFRKEELICLKGMAEMSCKLCLKPEITIEINECSKAILEGANALSSCENQALNNVTDLVVKLNKTTWAFVDSNPGTITESCDNLEPKVKQLELSHSGIITVNPDCRYIMTNTPVTVEEIDDDLHVQVVNRNDVTYYSYNPLEDSLFKFHIKSYSFSYFLVFSTIIGVFFLGTACYCVCEKRNGNVRIGFRRVPRREEPRLPRTVSILSLPRVNPPGFSGPVVQFVRRDGIEYIN